MNLFIIFLILQDNGPVPECPSGYTLAVGDIPGIPDLGSTIPVTSSDACAYLCEGEPTCCSYLWSEDDEECNLNTECAPSDTNANRPPDFQFCERGRSNSIN